MQINETKEEFLEGHLSKALITKNLESLNKGKIHIFLSDEEKKEIIRNNIKPII